MLLQISIAFGNLTVDKFVQEIFWRTYWGGWLELHPKVFDEYKRKINKYESLLFKKPILFQYFKNRKILKLYIKIFSRFNNSL